MACAPPRQGTPARRRGDWLAQQGDRGLSLGGLQRRTAAPLKPRLASASCGPPPAPQASGSSGGRAAAHSAPRRRLVPRPEKAQTGVPGACAGRVPSGDPLNDALDELLSHAEASLSYLDRLQAGLPPRAPSPARQKAAGRPQNSFWQPRCNAHLWSEGLSSASSFGSGASDASDEESEDDDEALWNYLREAYGGGPRPCSSERSARRRQPPRPPSRPAAAPQRPSERGAAPGPLPSARRRGSSSAPPRSPPPEPEPGRQAHRGQSAGFRFGLGAGAEGTSASRGANSSGAAGDSPEAQVSAALAAAAKGGHGVVKKTLKRLLLRWHPDKAPPGDGPEAVAARAEATRVLRFILSERERLGI